MPPVSNMDASKDIAEAFNNLRVAQTNFTDPGSSPNSPESNPASPVFTLKSPVSGAPASSLESPTSLSTGLSAHDALVEYLLKRDETFQQLHELKIATLNNPKADEHFAAQRDAADNADDALNKQFFTMTEQVAKELHRETRALKIRTPNPVVLDLCMAPGGYAAAAMKVNLLGSKLRGLTLPVDQGGHPVLVDVDGSRVVVEYGDITLLAAVMGVSKDEIPPDHPDAAKFRFDLPFADEKKFDLVFCDGQVLRTQERQSYRQRSEATRLLTSQLVLAFQRIKEGGTLIVLLHRIEQWTTAQLLYTMSKVSDIQLFKPKRTWAKRGSFYLIAKNVQPCGPEAEKAVKCWKDAWRLFTLDCSQDGSHVEGENVGEHGDGDERLNGKDVDISGVTVEQLLREFGPTLVDIGSPVWQIQLEGLRRAPWNR